MGYQESFIYTKGEENFQKVLSLIERLGKDYFEARDLTVYSTALVKMNLRYPFFYANRAKILKKGEKVIWISGERYAQRNLKRVFGKYVNELPSDTAIMFIDNFDNAYEIFSSKENAEKFFREDILDLKESPAEIKDKLKLWNKIEFQLDVEGVDYNRPDLYPDYSKRPTIYKFKKSGELLASTNNDRKYDDAVVNATFDDVKRFIRLCDDEGFNIFWNYRFMVENRLCHVGEVNGKAALILESSK